MGYIGLLLNDPYKIDRMMGDCLIYFFRLLFCLLLRVFLWAIGTNRYFRRKTLKMRVTRFLRVLGGV
jgi:hypothetical protein